MFYSIQITKSESQNLKSLSLVSLHDKNHEMLEMGMSVFGIILYKLIIGNIKIVKQIEWGINT